MKKFLAIFFITYIFSYANYLISNSEIVLFYDKSYNSVHYIKGDIFNNIDISKIEGKIILDKKEIISLNRYFEGVAVVPQTNILNLFYNIEGKRVVVTVIPSMIDKSKLYFLVEFYNFPFGEKSIDFAFRIVPQYDNKYIEYDEKLQDYKYDTFYFKSENYKGQVVLSRDSILEELIGEKIEKRAKKFQDDNLYYIIEDLKEGKAPVITFSFYKKFQDNLIRDNKEVMEKELEYWSEVNKKIKFFDRRKIFFYQLRNLEILTSRIVIPDEISYNKSKENLNNKIKLYYISSLYDKEFNINKFFEDIHIRKKDNEAVVYYNFLFKYLNENDRYLSSELVEKKIAPEVLSLLDNIEVNDGEIINIRDNIFNYYWYFELIENIVNRKEFIAERDFIIEKKKILLEYVRKNYILNSGIKSRKDDKQSYYKNIKFMNFLSEEEQISRLKSDYKKYYNRLYGLLKGEDDKERIDLRYNLEFIIKLYENKMTKEADILFSNVEMYIKKNDYYLIPKIYPDTTNPAGIYGELLYLYFTAGEYKERYGNGD